MLGIIESGCGCVIIGSWLPRMTVVCTSLLFLLTLYFCINFLLSFFYCSLSLSLSVSVCLTLSVCLSVCLSLFLSLSLSLSVSLSLFLSLSLSVSLIFSVSLSLSLSCSLSSSPLSTTRKEPSKWRGSSWQRCWKSPRKGCMWPTLVETMLWGFLLMTPARIFGWS